MTASPSRLGDFVTTFFPSLLVPTEANTAITIAAITMLLASYTLTYTGRQYDLMRLALFVPMVYYSYDVGFGHYPSPNRKV
jgi:hypothetical protein